MGITTLEPIRRAPSSTRRAIAFDIMAEDYTKEVTTNPSMMLMRRRTWHFLERIAQPGTSILDLGCGVGTDSIFLASNGCKVHAIDTSSMMLEQARKNARIRGMSHLIELEQRDIEDLDKASHLQDGSFSGILANFGSLNTLESYETIDRAFSRLLATRGWIVATIMGRDAIWDRLFSIFKNEGKGLAMKRLREGYSLQIGNGEITSYFPTPNEFVQQFPHFKQEYCEAIGLLYPPPGVTNRVRFLMPLWRTLANLEKFISSSRVFRGLGDHFLIILRKR